MPVEAGNLSRLAYVQRWPSGPPRHPTGLTCARRVSTCPPTGTTSTTPGCARTG